MVFHPCYKFKSIEKSFVSLPPKPLLACTVDSTKPTVEEQVPNSCPVPCPEACPETPSAETWWTIFAQIFGQMRSPFDRDTLDVDASPSGLFSHRSGFVHINPA